MAYRRRSSAYPNTNAPLTPLQCHGQEMWLRASYITAAQREAHATSRRCCGLTKQYALCRNNPGGNFSYCWRHGDQAAFDVGPAPEPEPPETCDYTRAYAGVLSSLAAFGRGGAGGTISEQRRRERARERAEREEQERRREREERRRQEEQNTKHDRSQQQRPAPAIRMVGREQQRREEKQRQEEQQAGEEQRRREQREEKEREQRRREQKRAQERARAQSARQEQDPQSHITALQNFFAQSAAFDATVFLR
ncbi:hypothetical protein R3P38DRAFT_3170350 [Favolaschia claudopus]|uniref:Uncharacterized protein n=1 Tax=Favolaschia claudopus TaxID=2862362 RepID=A0AAW0DWD7_9AGAR